MASLMRVVTVQWTDAAGSRVPAGTPGAKKVRVKSRKWYIQYREAGKLKRVSTDVTDKAAAKRVMADWLTARERGQVGLSDPFRKHYDRPIMDHVREYHAYVASHSRSPMHCSEVLRILTTVVNATGYKSIKDITPGTMSKYLSGMTQAAGTRNMHRRIMVGFCNWLESVGSLPLNPIGGKKLRTFKAGAGETKRKRRALTVEELHRLLAVAKEQPLKDAHHSRGGRPRKDGTPVRASRPAQLSPATIAAKTLEGRERHLMYQLAVYTGLRRGELSRLLVRHLHLSGAKPKLNLPGTLTKNGKDAAVPLPPFVAAELAAWVSDTGRGADDAVLHVPDKSNLTNIHQRLLTIACIAYKDERGRFADFHALRYTANVLLRRAGIPLKDRMVFLRHGSAALTDGTYEDEEHIDRAGILDAFREAASV